MTDAHLRVRSFIIGAGYGVMDEVSFPPYQVDLYLPDMHLAVEVDGPTHGRTADMKRDRYLLDVYALLVFHIATDEQPGSYMDRLHDYAYHAGETVDGRFTENIKDRLPWL